MESPIERERQKGIRVKAALLEAPGTELIVEDIDYQEPQAGEVLVRIVASGVCHSDLNVVHGTQTSPLPVVLAPVPLNVYVP